MWGSPRWPARDLATLMRADSGLSVKFHALQESRSGEQRAICLAWLDGAADRRST